MVIHLSAYGLEYPEPSAYLAWSSSCPYSEHTTCFGVLPVIVSALISICLSILFLTGVGQRIFANRRNSALVEDVQSNDESVAEVEAEKIQVMRSDHVKQSPILSSENSDDCLLNEVESEVSDTVLIKGLTKQFSGGKVAVDNLYLGIRKGECFGLLGHNGAGAYMSFTPSVYIIVRV